MKKDQKGHKSNGSLNSSYFTELKLTKTDLNDSKASLGSSKSQENKIKKRLAPAPPPPPPPPQQHDNIDKCLHHNIYSYAKKKGKAPAPPPPKPSQQIEQIEPVESQQQQELT